MTGSPQPPPGMVIAVVPANGLSVFRTDPIAWLEAACALALGLRAVWMLWPTWQSIPLGAQGYFIPHHLSETTWGYILAALAVAQAVCVWCRVPWARCAVSTLIALLIGMTVLAYYGAGDEYRGVVPLIIAVLLEEMVIAGQAWTDLLVPRERRRRPRPPPAAPEAPHA